MSTIRRDKRYKPRFILDNESKRSTKKVEFVSLTIEEKIEKLKKDQGMIIKKFGDAILQLLEDVEKLKEK